MIAGWTSSIGMRNSTLNFVKKKTGLPLTLGGGEAPSRGEGRGLPDLSAGRRAPLREPVRASRASVLSLENEKPDRRGRRPGLDQVVLRSSFSVPQQRQTDVTGKLQSY